jgi:hypothetical protein
MDGVINYDMMEEDRAIESLFDYEISQLDPNRVRVIMKDKNGKEVGVLYFEKAKKTFFRKPVSLGGWACVDAKIDDLYEKAEYNITPKDIVGYCQELILWAGY